MQKRSFVRPLSFFFAVILMISVCASAFAKYQTIPLGEKSDAVRTMQTALKKKGFYKGTVDGNFGPATRRAVYKFQSSIGIKADGKPGNKTLTALYEGTQAINNVNVNKAIAQTPTNPRTLYHGCTGSRVRALQKALKATGHFKGTIDGTYGDLTELAVRKFQTAKGMHVDGIAGSQTLARLNNAQKEVKISETFVLDKGSRGTTVKNLQNKLYALGYTPGSSYPKDTSGTYGDGTADMVKQWQRNTGRAASGTLSESQYNALIGTKNPS